MVHNCNYFCNHKFTSQVINCFLQHYEFIVYFVLQILLQPNHCLIRNSHRPLHGQFMGHKKEGTPFKNSSASFNLEKKKKYPTEYYRLRICKMTGPLNHQTTHEMLNKTSSMCLRLYCLCVLNFSLGNISQLHCQNFYFLVF